ncbi:MAG: fumarylacetoacetate hydrolase family protein [Azospirillaceae bacterium]
MLAEDRARAVQLLADQRIAARALEGLPAALRPHDETTAYALQDSVVARLEHAGLGPVIGFKIGATSAAMQSYLGIDHPCCGLVLAADRHPSPARLPRSSFLNPGLELEIAVRLGTAIGPGDGPFTAASVAPAVAAAMTSIEIVDARWRDFRAVDTPSLIADGFFHAALVLGPEAPVPPGGLADLEGVMTIDGREIGRDRGAAILGDPFEALAWLARHRAAHGQGLPAGTIVTLGSLIPPAWLDGPCEAVVTVEALGEARVAVA